MAEPIVRQFVIDTTESEQNLKELNVQINATSTAINQGAQSFENVAAAEETVVTSSKSLKAQLRELQAQLANTEPDSAKYRELSQAAGELKDKIQDAAQAVGTQAGGAFERVGGSLGLVTSRISNLDFEGAAEGAKLLAQNISQVKPGDIAKGIQSIGSAFASVGKALLTNPIFLIGAAIAAAIVYADELLSLVDGVTDAEQKSLNVQKEKAALAKEQVDAIGAQEESLKRQGLTEKQITELKLKALDTAILEQEVVVQTNKAQAKAQTEAAKRNAQYLRGFLEFVTLPQRKLAEFFQTFVNGAIKTLNFFGAEIEQVNFTKVFDDVNDFLTKKIFDPDKVQKDGEAVIKESEKALVQLKNQRDGILNAQDAKEKADAKKLADDKLKIEQDLNAQLLAARQKAFEQSQKLSDLIRKDAQKSFSTKSSTSTLSNFDSIINAQRDAEELRLSLLADSQEKEIALVDQKYIRLRDQAKGNAELMAKLAEANQREVNAIIEKGTRQQILVNAESFKKGLELVQSAVQVIQAFSDASNKKGEADARKQFKRNKALAIGAATVQTAQAVTGALTAGGNPVKLATGAQFVEAGLAAALGLAQIIKIKNSQFEGGGSDNQTTNTTTPSVSDTGGGSQPAQFNPLASSFLQERPEQITPRAYVLASDVASAAEVRENVADLARIG